MQCGTNNNRGIKSSCHEKVYRELGLEYLYQRGLTGRLYLIFSQPTSHSRFVNYYSQLEALVDMLLGNTLLDFVRSGQKKPFIINDLVGKKLLTRL